MLWRNGGRMLSCQLIPTRELLLAADEQRPAAPATAPPLTPDTPPSRPSAGLLAAELLWIVRPLAYLLVLFKYGSRSWRPWLVSLAIDVASRQAALRSRHAALFSERERDELARRSVLWLFYVLRP